MTEYWKSYAKKYCDVCKCWITDNKASVQFHENGKRHKENVGKKINELVKKATKENKEKKQLDDDMKKMEEAALRAYMKDVEENPDHSAQYVKEKLDTQDIDSGKSETDASCGKEKDKSKTTGRATRVEATGNTEETDTSVSGLSSAKVWYEARSDEGYTYYWNTQTNESLWQAPEDYVTLDEQKKVEERQKNVNEKNQKQKKAKDIQQQKAKKEEIRAAVEREKMKEKYGKQPMLELEDSAQEESIVEQPTMGPQAKVDPYGAWTSVSVPQDDSEMDLQLPPSYQPPVQPISYIAVSEPAVKIKEKTLDPTMLDRAEPAAFKKRKTCNRGNTRQRFSDDD